MITIQTIQEQLSSSEGVAIVTDWLQRNKQQGRRALARHLCQALDLNDAHTGKPRLAGVQKALRVLESQGYWQLPKNQAAPQKQWNPRRLDQTVPLPQGVPPRVETVAGLHLVEVTSRDDALFRLWNELILTEHPLHDCRLVGRQVRYLIGSDHGWLGAIGFGACALRLKVRDEWIGWPEPIRKAFQERLINMTRFLIRPQVRCDNLASRVLSLCMDRIGDDFMNRYGIEPWLVESFVDGTHYAGTCYQAANWLCIGTTAGRGRNAPKRPVTSCKDVYLYVLNRHWQRNIIYKICSA